MLSYFLYNSVIVTVTWCIQKQGEPSLHDWPEKQISGNVSANFAAFLFQSTKWKDSPNILENRTF